MAGKLVKLELNFAQESSNCVVVRSRGADRVCRLSIDHRNFTRIDGENMAEHVKKYTLKGVKN